MTLFEHLFGAALPDFSQPLCTAWLGHAALPGPICTKSFPEYGFFFFFLPNGTDCYFWLSNPSWVFSVSWGAASPVTLVGMDVAVSSSSVYTCLQRRALGVAMLAPPPVTPHLPLLTPESYFLMWAAHPKKLWGGKVSLLGYQMEQIPSSPYKGLLWDTSSMVLTFY